jgi:hypothetical protein
MSTNFELHQAKFSKNIRGGRGSRSMCRVTTSPSLKSLKDNVRTVNTVDSLLAHTPRWTPKAMGYEGLWVMKDSDDFWCKITIRLDSVAQKIMGYKGLWVIRAMGYYEGVDCM